MQILGNVAGFIIGGIAVATDQFALGFRRARHPRARDDAQRRASGFARARRPKSRDGRSWSSVAAEAWGTDVLRERSFVWLVASRLAILMAGGVLTNLALFYLVRSLADGAGRGRHLGHDHRRASSHSATVVTVVPGGPAVRSDRAQDA